MIDKHGLIDVDGFSPRRQPGFLVPHELAAEVIALLDAPPGVRFNLGPRIDQFWLPPWSDPPDPDEIDDCCMCGTEVRDHTAYDGHSPVGMHGYRRSLRQKDARFAFTGVDEDAERTRFAGHILSDGHGFRVIPVSKD